MSEPTKICPKCQTVALLDARTCSVCAHGFRTQFVAPDDKTQMYPPSDLPSVYSPPQYPPPNAQCPPPNAQYPPPNAQYPPPNAQHPPQYPPVPQPVYVVSGDSIQVPAGTHPVPLIAIVGVFCLPLGMMMNRQFIKALVVLMCGIGIGFVTAGIGTILIGFLAWIDSILVANRLNRGEVIGQWTSF